MKPTSHLRFVLREAPSNPFYRAIDNNGNAVVQKYTVLQQWWASDPDSLMDWTLKQNGEWFDVELEQEEK